MKQNQCLRCGWDHDPEWDCIRECPDCTIKTQDQCKTCKGKGMINWPKNEETKK
ncbi:MAG: hypothetical protein ABFC98_05800 [Candidatus Cloacimonas sp.]